MTKLLSTNQPIMPTEKEKTIAQLIDHCQEQAERAIAQMLQAREEYKITQDRYALLRFYDYELSAHHYLSFVELGLELISRKE